MQATVEQFKIYVPLNNLFRSFGNLHPGKYQDRCPLHFHYTEEQRKDWRPTNFERHMRMIGLIMVRIRQNAEIAFDSERHGLFHNEEMQLDLETFLIFLRIAMDDVAGFTPYFYSDQIGKINATSFNKQRHWFINKNTTLDEEWSKYLAEKCDWFDEVKDYRDDLVHRDLYGFIEKDWSTGKIRSKGIDNKQKISDLISYIGDKYSRFFEFLYNYESHFTKVASATYPEIRLNKEWDVWMSKSDRFKTILFFLEQGKCKVDFILESVKTELN